MAYSMSDLLQLVVSEGSSDLHIRVGVPPTIRVHGILHRWKARRAVQRTRKS
jgi:Tfp pilus assembly pilus retraction ATPase PilT